MADKVTQQQVLDVFISAPDECLPSTTVADRMGAPEISVRAAMSWLQIGGYLVITAGVKRTTSGGYRYCVATYRWSGKVGPIQPVPQKPEHRESNMFNACATALLQHILTKEWRK